MHHAAVKALLLLSVVTTLAISFPDDPPPLPTYEGTGTFLMLSDIHFDPFGDSAVAGSLGAKLNEGCRISDAGSIATVGNDTNYPLLKSTLDEVVATAAQNHFRYDFVIVTGDLLAHSFDTRYAQCVGGGEQAYRKFSSDTIRFVDGMISKALPGIPVFAALGNNDSDRGDYQEPSNDFLESVGQDWSRAWGNLPLAARKKVLSHFERAGYYAAPDPVVAKHCFVILNSNLWAARNTQACSATDLDPGGQFQWLGQVLSEVKQAGGTATLIMHIPPGIDAMRSSTGQPQSLWPERCTERLVEKLTDFRGVVREIYAGHIHRDDFRILPDREGRPLATVHIIPSVSPVYFNNPAVEIGWYNRNNGDLRDYAAVYLDLAKAQSAWTTEYVFTQAYGSPRPSLARLEKLSRVIHAGNPDSGAGEQYAKYYAAGVRLFLTPENWSNYSCAQTEIIVSHFALCKQAAAGR